MSWTSIIFLSAAYFVIEYMLPNNRKYLSENIMNRCELDEQNAREDLDSNFEERFESVKIARELICQVDWESPELFTSFQFVSDEVLDSTINSVSDYPMIPLCVPFTEKDQVKQLGALWCAKKKTWYWGYDQERDPVDKWLPKFYKTESEGKIILEPRLVPKPLRGMSIRLFLTNDQFSRLWQQTNDKFGHRCCICGCQDRGWPLECDEIWSYEIDRISHTGIYKFEGLQSLCSGCHLSIHFGNGNAYRKRNKAISRIMYINAITSYDAAIFFSDLSCEDWEIESEINNWILNTDVLEAEYGVEIGENPYLTKIA